MLRLFCPWIAAALLLAPHCLGQNPKAGKAGKAATKQNAGMRADILKLLEVEGTRELVEQGLKMMAGQSKASVVEACPFCTPQFHDEFAKRFEARLSAANVLTIYAEIYERHYSREEVVQLIALGESRRKDPVTAATPALQTKIDAVKAALQSEIHGKTSEYANKAGVEIFVQLEKEHPDWVKRP